MSFTGRGKQFVLLYLLHVANTGKHIHSHTSQLRVGVRMLIVTGKQRSGPQKAQGPGGVCVLSTFSLLNPTRYLLM